jgi:thioredoxin 1
MMLVREGRMVDMKLGAMPKGKILEWLAEMGVTTQAA